MSKIMVLKKEGRVGKCFYNTQSTIDSRFLPKNFVPRVIKFKIYNTVCFFKTLQCSCHPTICSKKVDF